MSEGVRALRDIEYARPGGKPLLLDLYLPEKTDAPLPLIVWIHGGAWQGGSKEDCPAVGMTARGYAAASINYRLSHEAIFPAQIHDCKAAVRWLRANAQKYGFDPDRIGAWGSSAGGHLVALLGTSGGVEELEGDLGNAEQSSSVQAVVDFCGPTDLTRIAEAPSDISRKSADCPEAMLIGGMLHENPEKAAAASPVTYATKDAAPFLIMHGENDTIVPLQQGELMHAALTKAGAEVTFEVVKDAGHGFGGPDIDRMVNDFFDAHLKKTEKK